MQQILEFLFVLAFGIRLRGPHDAHARGFEHPSDVIRGSFSARTKARHELPPDLLDLGWSEPRNGKLARDLQDQFLLGWMVLTCHCDDLTGLDLFFAEAGAGGASAAVADGFRNSSSSCR